MAVQSEWLAQQEGNVVQFELVEHTLLNEDTGEMHCERCGVNEKTFGNRRRDFVAHIRQQDIFERFTAEHLHGRSAE